jgi:hypothetical protein
MYVLVVGRCLFYLLGVVRCVMCLICVACHGLMSAQGRACPFLPQRVDLFICNSACRLNLIFWIEIFRVIHPLSSNTGFSTL